jgi:hypothetical protein
MADHFVSLNRGESGMNYSDFTTGAASTATDQFELRVKDGAGVTKIDVVLALEAFERFFNNAQQVSASGFDVKG